MTASPAGSPPAQWQVWTALGLVYVVWGSTYLAIRFTVATAPPLLSAGLRFLVAASLLLVWLLVRRGRSGVTASRGQLRNAAGTGVLLLVGGNGLVTLGQEAGVPSGLAALLVAVVPLWVVLLRAGSGDRPAAGTVAGVALGFVGVAVLLLPGARPTGVALLPVVGIVGSSLLWSIGSFAATRLDLPPEPLLTTVVQMLAGGVVLVTGGLLRSERVDPSAISAGSALAWAYLVVFGSIVGFTAYSWLLGVAPVSQVATYAYVNPVVAVLLGALLAGETVGAATLLGGAVTVLAVAVVVSQEGRRRRAVRPRTTGRAGSAAP